ncbi:MAG: hypothetical protein AB8F78_12070 [Saprospiraceae bacterium]
MRFPAALLFCFSACLLWTACDNDDDVTPIVATTIDCSVVNTFDTSACSALNTSDSVAYVNSFLGSWYLAAYQDSGFGGSSTECINYTEAESPYTFTFNPNYTWRVVQTGDFPADTTLGWSITSGFGGWRLGSNSSRYPAPELNHLCDGDLVTDLRPVDGPLRVYVKAN